MALIKCPNCEGTVSTKAHACPHCGASPVIAKAILTGAQHHEAQSEPSSGVVSRICSSGRSFFLQEMPDWINRLVTTFLFILGTCILVVWVVSIFDDTTQENLVSRESLSSGGGMSQKDVDFLFDLHFPGLREQIGIVAFDVKRREFRKTYDYDRLPKTSPPKP